MHNADRAVLRIGTGIALAAFLCYGLALPMPHLGVIMAWVVLCRPGEPLGLKQGLAGFNACQRAAVWLKLKR